MAQQEFPGSTPEPDKSKKPSAPSSQDGLEQYRFPNWVGIGKRLQQSTPDWRDTRAQLWVVKEITDLAAALNQSNSEGEKETSTGIADAQRSTQRIFSCSLENLIRYCQRLPMQRMQRDTLETATCEFGAPDYNPTYLCSLLTVQTALEDFSGNRPMLERLFAEMRQHPVGMLLLLKDDDIWAALGSSLLNTARREPIFRSILLRQRWLGFVQQDFD